MFRYAAGAGAPNGNLAVNVRDALAPVPLKRRWPAVIDLEELRLLVRDVDRAAASPITRLCSRFLALTAQRPGIVRTMGWREVEGVDWTEDVQASDSVWRVPAARMKFELDLREDEAFEHVVPLSRAAVDVLRTVCRLAVPDLVFPGGRAPRRTISSEM